MPKRRGRSETGQAGLISHGWRDVAGYLSDEIGNLVGPVERPHKEVRAG
jgi:hypothetical protein